MKLLLDQGLPRSTVRYLRDYGMIVDHVADIGLDRAADEDIIAYARSRGHLINQVQYRHDSILIKRDGKPVAALVDARLFERIRRMQVRFDALCQRIEAGYATVPEAEGLAEIDAAVADIRAGR